MSVSTPRVEIRADESERALRVHAIIRPGLLGWRDRHPPSGATAEDCMPLLLIPLAVLLLVALWLVLLPWSLWMRYRSGRARRRPQAWVVHGNAWLLAASLPLFLGTAWLMDRWMRDALRDAALGLLLGTLFGIVSVWLTRFERDARGLAYTPNRWPVLLLTGLVAARVLAGFWRTWQHLTGAAPDAFAHWLDGGGWTGIAGLFLGYGLAYTWGLRARLARG